jgi:hypothetical protein
MWNDRKCCKDRKEGVLIENIYVFYHVCLVGRMEMWEDRNFFVFLYLVEKKNEKMKIVVYKNLLLHPYCIAYNSILFYFIFFKKQSHHFKRRKKQLRLVGKEVF